jgi:hypothetical protein
MELLMSSRTYFQACGRASSIRKLFVAAHFRFVHCLLFFHSLGLVDATLIPMEDQWVFFVDDRQFMKKF